MPGNTVSINNGWREYYVGDSKMEDLLKYLDEHGVLEAEEEMQPSVAGEPELVREMGPSTSGGRELEIEGRESTVNPAPETPRPEGSPPKDSR